MGSRSFRRCLPKGLLLIPFKVSCTSPTVSGIQPHTNTEYMPLFPILTIASYKENSRRATEPSRAGYSQGLVELL